MSRNTPKDRTVYSIFDRKQDSPEGVYSRAYGDDYTFSSPDEARRSNCHDIYKCKGKYRIAKYRVTYELIDPDCDVDGEAPEYPTPDTRTISERLDQMILDMALRPIDEAKDKS